MTSAYGMMIRSLSFIVLPLLLVSCSSKYSSKYEAEIAKDKWIKEGGYYKVENPPPPECEDNDNDYLGNLAEQKRVDCSTTYSSEPNRICKEYMEKRQFACFSLDEKTKPEWTFFKY